MTVIFLNDRNEPPEKRTPPPGDPPPSQETPPEPPAPPTVQVVEPTATPTEPPVSVVEATPVASDSGGGMGPSSSNSAGLPLLIGAGLIALSGAIGTAELARKRE